MDNPETSPTGSSTKWQATYGFSQDPRFCMTSWTIVAKASEGNEEDASEAMAQLCRSYWYPLYAYVRRSGKSREEAEDLTQEFFARVIQKDILRSARKEKGKLRTFLLTVMKRFLIKEWQHENAQKRGGSFEHLSLDFEEGEQRYVHEPADVVTPDLLYEKQWATTVLGRVMESLKQDYTERGKGERFESLKDALWWNSADGSYANLGEKLGMKENAVKQAVSRLRKQYRERLKEEIRNTLDTEDDSEIEEELRHLIRALREN